MNTYLITYGCENEMWMCHAASKEAAIEEFLNADVVDPDEGEDAISAVFLCQEV